MTEIKLGMEKTTQAKLLECYNGDGIYFLHDKHHSEDFGEYFPLPHYETSEHLPVDVTISAAYKFNELIISISTEFYENPVNGVLTLYKDLLRIMPFDGFNPDWIIHGAVS